MENINEQQTAAAPKKKKHGKLIVLIVILVILALLILGCDAAFGGPITTHVKTFDDPSDFDKVFVEENADGDKEYQVATDGVFDIIPDDPAGEITDFCYIYYDPWDAQRIAAVTVQYDDADYESELQRMEKFGTADVTGVYSVTGEAPEGYEFVAMVQNDTKGFSYAMVPEDEDDSITYVVIDFCNGFLDLDIHKYFPEQYLLPGFNAEENNPYMQQLSEEWEDYLLSAN